MSQGEDSAVDVGNAPAEMAHDTTLTGADDPQASKASWDLGLLSQSQRSPHRPVAPPKHPGRNSQSLDGDANAGIAVVNDPEQRAGRGGGAQTKAHTDKTPTPQILATEGATVLLPASPPAHNPSDLSQPDSSSQLHDPNTNTSRHTRAESGEVGDKMMLFENGPTRRRKRDPVLGTTWQNLTHADKKVQKDAVKKYILEVVKNDWEWPPTRTAPPSIDSSEEQDPSQAESCAWKERDEWMSLGSEGEEEFLSPGTEKDITSPDGDDWPSHLDSGIDKAPPNGQPGATVQGIESILKNKKRRRKKRLADEIGINPGLKCFVERRDAWTGAKKVPRSPVLSPTTAARLKSSRGSVSEVDLSSTTVDPAKTPDDWECDTEIPLAPAIIPPENVMRRCITPGAYHTIYDKIIIQSLTPSCPLNLKDVTRSCVEGWKRDGQWGPPTTAETQKTQSKSGKLTVAGLFGLERSETAKKEVDKADAEKGRDSEKSPSTGSFKKGLKKVLHRKKKEA